MVRPTGREVLGSSTVNVELDMLLTSRRERSQSGVMCSGLSPVL